MSFIPKGILYHKNDNTKIYLKDTTGVFDATGNPGGWDNGGNTSGNPKLSDVDNARAVFVWSDGTTTTVDIKSPSIPFPNYADIPIEITAAMAGRSSFGDGLTKVSVFYDGFFDNDPLQFWSSEWAAQDFFTMNTQCCVQKLFTKVDTTVDFCKNANWNKAVEAEAMLHAIWNAAGNQYQLITGCNQVLKANEMLSQLQTICANSGCSCGC